MFHVFAFVWNLVRILRDVWTEMKIFCTVLVCMVILMQRDSDFVGSVVETFYTFVGIVVKIIICTFLGICTKTVFCDFTIFWCKQHVHYVLLLLLLLSKSIFCFCDYLHAYNILCFCDYFVQIMFCAFVIFCANNIIVLLRLFRTSNILWFCDYFVQISFLCIWNYFVQQKILYCCDYFCANNILRFYNFLCK
jgi:hypothetical protein